MGKDYLKETKSEGLLYEAAKEWGVDAKAQMYKLPAMYVGPYAEQDADLTLRLWQYFKVEIIKQELSSIFDLETRLFPCLLDMKSKGVRVDLDKADKIKKDLQKKETTLLTQIKKDTGVDVDIWAAVSVAKAFDKLKLPLSPGSRDVSEITPLSNIIVFPLIKIESTNAGLVSFSHK